MSTELIVALVSGMLALLATGIAVWGNLRVNEQSKKFELLRIAEQRRIEAEREISKFREPLARAAYDLQSRLYNILIQNLIGVYLINGDDRERSYVIDNTTYLIAQYFA